MTGQAPQAGFLAWQVRRPWKISTWLSIVQSRLGTSAPMACSALTGSVSVVQPNRRASLPTWVSTVIPGTPNALPSTTLAATIQPQDGPYYAVIAALTLYNGSVIAELVRSGVRSLPRGQREAAAAVGMTSTQSLRLVEVPQALIAMLPSLLSQFVVILKDSALGYLIGFFELLQYARQLGSGNGNILQSLVVAAMIFIVINFLLTWAATRLSRRLSSRTAGDASTPTTPRVGAPTDTAG